jgi:signal recognition particle subunit SRP54
MDTKKAEQLQEKILKQQFTLEDFLDQIRELQKVGSMEQLLSMIPGGSKLAKMQGAGMDESQIKKVEAIILSMTIQDRRNPEIIGGSRRNRIARGSGTRPADVNQLLRQFKDAKKMMKQMTSGRLGKMMKKGMLPFG